MSAIQLDPRTSPTYDAGTSTPAFSFPDEKPGAWNPFQLIGFRLAFCFFMLFSVPRILVQAPLLGGVASWLYYAPMQALAKWFGAHVFHVPIVIAPTGSGDTMVRWVEIAIQLGMAAVAAIVWSVADRKRRDYRQLHEWLRVAMRYCLAFILFGYGFAKIWPNQFPYPTLERLAEPLGEFSPMGLLWNFMGYSVPYNFFTGMGEAVASMLLCFRRTTTAGALLMICVMSNVVFLNYAYDVPVKLFSTIYLVMAVFLVLPDAKRLLDVLLFNRRAEPRVERPLIANRKGSLALSVTMGLLVGWVLYGNVTGNLARFRQSTNAPLPALYGIYDVRSLTKNGKDVPLVVTDASLWRKVIFARFDRLSIRTMSDSMARYTVKVDTAKHSMLATARFDTTQKLAFAYERQGDQLLLRGTIGADSIVARMKRLDESKFLLNSRGYSWVQEQPFNR